MFEGVKVWCDSDVLMKMVEIDGFVFYGLVFVLGVVDVDEDICLGDEVVVEGLKVFVIGCVEMGGCELVEFMCGIGVEICYVEEW